MTKSNRVRAVLLEGPSTANEVSTATGMSLYLASAWLGDLTKRGHAIGAGRAQGQRRCENLYAITPRGAAWLRKTNLEVSCQQ